MDSHSFSFIVGALAAAIVLVLIVALREKAGGLSGFSEKNYDERQQRARGIAFKSGFFTMVAYSFLYGASDLLCDKPWCDLFTGNLLGIVIGTSVFAVVSIMKDAYMSLKDRPKKMMLLFAVIFLLNLGIALMRTLEGEKLTENGMLTFVSANYIVAAMLMVIFAAMGVKSLVDRKAASE